VTPSLWALAALLVASALLCLWAGLTGRPDPAPKPQHADWDGRTEPLWYPDDDETRVMRVPIQRWYDEDPWPHGRPHGWGPTRD
jgi:hypothetical protein